MALEAIRKLGRSGVTVFASDSISTAPGNHSAYTQRGFKTASPSFDTHRFIEDLHRILRDTAVDTVLPTFEEIFFLARHRHRLEPHADLFLAPFELLRTLHNKASLQNLARDLRIPTPESEVVTSSSDLIAAARGFGKFVARPAYSRGGTSLVANAGPRAGRGEALDACRPSPSNPYIVQRYVSGTDVCTYSIVQHGRVGAHVSYVHPVSLNQTYGISFESITDPETLGATQAICEATGFHGQMSLDFLRTDDGLVLVECNPRTTSGITMMPDAMLVDALNNAAPDSPQIAPAGTRRKMSLVILLETLKEPRLLRRTRAELFGSSKDIFWDRKDLMPFFWQFIAVGSMVRNRIRANDRANHNLVDAYLSDTLWNGQPID